MVTVAPNRKQATQILTGSRHSKVMSIEVATEGRMRMTQRGLASTSTCRKLTLNPSLRTQKPPARVTNLANIDRVLLYLGPKATKSASLSGQQQKKLREKLIKPGNHDMHTARACDK